MSSFITVEKRHFEHLLQRAEAPRPSQNTSHVDMGSVTIGNTEYKSLLQAADQLKKLKETLLKGGLSQETLHVLIYGSSRPPNVAGDSDVSNETCGELASCVDKYHDHGESNYKLARGYDDLDDDGDEEVLLASQASDEKDDYDESSRSTAESSVGPTVRRTIMIRGLPDKVTHRDIVDSVRGGALLHIYLRARDHNASVSFVEEADAHEFYNHAKNHGLSVAGKRVEIGWNDRQFYLPPYVRTKIKNGASRNLVIYTVNPNITEWVIRKDLDHIHNLIVVTVNFKHGNAYISTNSVHNALFARSCMMSRLTYKGMKIGFYPDECTAHVATKPSTSSSLKRNLQVPPVKPVAIPNRFQLLSLNEGDDNDDSDHDEKHHLNDGRFWADSGVSV